MTTDNSDVRAKVQVREKVLEMMGAGPVRVLDLYAGRGLMKDLVWADAAEQYLGLEKRFSRSDTWRGDNLKMLNKAMQAGQWNVFDLDAYGNPWVAAGRVCKMIGAPVSNRRPLFGMALTCGICRGLRSSRAGNWARKTAGLEGITDTRLLRRFYDELVRGVIGDWQADGIEIRSAFRVRSRRVNDVVYWALLLQKRS